MSSTSAMSTTGRTCCVRKPLTSRLATCHRLRNSTASCFRLVAGPRSTRSGAAPPSGFVNLINASSCTCAILLSRLAPSGDLGRRPAGMPIVTASGVVGRVLPRAVEPISTSAPGAGWTTAACPCDKRRKTSSIEVTDMPYPPIPSSPWASWILKSSGPKEAEAEKGSR
eukprot:scaffold13160_cov106-Isochrysis_galbana.AAC.2